jgi:hypothetical protein
MRRQIHSEEVPFEDDGRQSHANHLGYTQLGRYNGKARPTYSDLLNDARERRRERKERALAKANELFVHLGDDDQRLYFHFIDKRGYSRWRTGHIRLLCEALAAEGIVLHKSAIAERIGNRKHRHRNGTLFLQLKALARLTPEEREQFSRIEPRRLRTEKARAILNATQ